jgi:hypothetical protein
VINSTVANGILDDIDAGLGDGRRYSPAPHAKDRAAWPVALQHVPSLTEAQAKRVIKTWRDKGVLQVRIPKIARKSMAYSSTLQTGRANDDANFRPARCGELETAPCNSPQPKCGEELECY